jgi:DNA-binding response OmpR family regulator
MRSGRLLVVDDETEITDLLEEFFTSLGYHVEVAHDGADAVMLAGLRRPDAVLLDIAMPQVSGEEVLVQLQRLDSTLPVIMLTGNADEELALRLLKTGAFDYVAKPVQLDVLERIVSTAVAVGGGGPG